MPLVPALLLLAAGALTGGVLTAILWAVSLILLAFAGWIVYQKLSKAWTFKTAMNAGLSKVYNQPVEFRDVDLAATELKRDVNLRKFSAEMAATACEWRRDFTLGAEDLPHTVTRLYISWADSSFITLSLMSRTDGQRMWPAQPWMSGGTYFEDGLRLFSASAGMGYRGPKVDLPVIARYFPDAYDPAAFVARHRAVVRRLISEGRRPVRPDPKAYFELGVREHEEAARALRGKTIYSWGDALHEAFDVVRKEFLEPADLAAR